MSTTIQILALASESTFDQPTTTPGRQWKKALAYVASCPSWYCALWGRHVESPDQITLLIDWNQSSAAQNFINTYYPHLIELLSPLLTGTPDLPYATNISPFLMEPGGLPCGGGVTTITKLTYNFLSSEQRMYLRSVFDVYTQGVNGWAEENEAALRFKGGAAEWAVDATGQRTATLWMLMCWETLEAEKRCEETILAANGRNYKEEALGPMLDKADPGWNQYHVVWEMITPDIMKWWEESENTQWPYTPWKKE